MSDARAKELIDLGNRLFLAKGPLDTLCQELAENCYPERADFTRNRNLGDDYAAHLSDSYPVLARRELGNSFSSVLRPRDKAWFECSTFNDTLDNDPGNARFLEYLTSETRSGMYDPRTDFIGATKMADHDFATFGNAVVSVQEAPRSRDHLFYKVHHFRDCAWLENEIGVVDHLHYKEKMTARQMERMFGAARLHESVKKACSDNPAQEFNVRVITLPADEYDYVGSTSKALPTGGKSRRGRKLPFVICYLDADNVTMLREGGLHDFIYMVARWHRIPGFQYAFSPAAMTALPDSRMAQDLALLILEAGEKAVYPPALAREEAVEQANLQAGSLTWADLESDQRLEDAMRYMSIDADMRVGFEMRKDVREMLTRAWFLDKLRLPEPQSGRTAYEIARVIEDHVRNLLPLFEPMEVEYNNKLLDKSFGVLSNMRRFDWSAMPQALSKRDTFWRFKNPMQEASSRELVGRFGEVMQVIKVAQEFGLKSSPIRLDVAVKDAIRGTSAPAEWRKTEEEEAQEAAAAEARARIAGMAQELAAAGDVADKIGKGAQSLQQAGVIPGPPRDERGNPVALPPPRIKESPTMPPLYPQEIAEAA